MTDGEEWKQPQQMPDTTKMGKLLITVTCPIDLPSDTMLAILKRLWNQAGQESLDGIDPRLQGKLRLHLGAEVFICVPE